MFTDTVNMLFWCWSSCQGRRGVALLSRGSAYSPAIRERCDSFLSFLYGFEKSSTGTFLPLFPFLFSIFLLQC